MKRRGSSKGGRRKFETWKNPPAQPSPIEKQKLDVVSHSALLSSSPGTPTGPRSSPVLREPSEEVSEELSTSSQAESYMQSRLCQVQDSKQQSTQGNCSLPPCPVWSRPPGEGTKSPNKATSTVLKGPGPHTHPWETPPLTLTGASVGSSEDQLVKMLVYSSQGIPNRPPSRVLPTPPPHCLQLLAPVAWDQGRQDPPAPLGLEAPPYSRAGSELDFFLPEWRVFCYPPRALGGSSGPQIPVYSP